MKSIVLIGSDGKRIGDFTLEEARKMAKDENKELKLVNAVSNIYKISDLGRLKYEEKQKKKQLMQQKRTHKVKEVQLRPSIEAHDLDVKSKHIKEFLSKGLKTKVVMKFKHREMSHSSIAEQKLASFISEFVDSGLATVDKLPKYEGHDLIVFLNPNKDKKS